MMSVQQRLQEKRNLNMSIANAAASDDELEVVRSSKGGELDELLGGSDDEGEGNGNELNDLLGSDDESEHSLRPDDDDQNTRSNDQEESRTNELDQILGKADVKTAKDQRIKTLSKVVLPATYKVPANNASVFVRTPNFIKIQMEEYDEALYNDETERTLFEGSTAVVRWRVQRDENGEIVCDSAGKPLKESNARMIQWSDGSVQLVVGDAVFQCKNVDVDNCYVYEQQNVQVLPTTEEEMDEGKTDSVMECVGSIHQRLVLQPTSLDSESHARMSAKISQKHKKESKIQSRDYEQITEKPEKTLANLARIEEEQMRRDRKAKERQYGQVNTITGAARSIRRPAMNAEYLAGGGFDEDEGDVEELAFERLDRERAAMAQKNRSKQPAGKPKQAAKKDKKKGPVSNDYLEYDEEDGSDMEDNDEEGEGDDVMIDDHTDDDEEEEDEDEEEEDEDEEEEDEDADEGSDDGGDGSESEESVKKKPSKRDAGDKKKGGKKESKEARKARKAEKRARRKEEKRAKKREDRESSKKDSVSSKKRPAEAESAGAVEVPRTDEAGDDQDEDEEEVAVQQRKRIKRAILDSDEDE